MSLWRQLTRGLRALTHRNATDADVTDELRHYLDLSAASHERRGLAPDAARRAAQLEIGNMTVAREQVRSYGWENAAEAHRGHAPHTFPPISDTRSPACQVGTRAPKASITPLASWPIVSGSGAMGGMSPLIR